MLVSKNFEPWEHFIAGNFFPPELLQKTHEQFLCTKNFLPWTGYTGRSAKYVKECPEILDYLENVVIPKFVLKCQEQLSVRGLPLNRDSYEIMNAMFCIDKIGYTVPIHTDIPEKCITFIIYVNGKGSCTSLLKMHGGLCVDSNISPNSALIFVPRENITYHTVNPTCEIRHTIQLTIQLKKV